MSDNTLKPELVRKKKNCTVCYHTVCESVAMGESLTSYINGDETPADFFTKGICSGKRMYKVNNILHDMYDDKFKSYEVADETSIPKPNTSAHATWED